MTELKMSSGVCANNRWRLDSFNTTYSEESTDAPGNLSMVALESSFNELLIEVRDLFLANSEPTIVFHEPSATALLYRLPN